MVSGVADDPGVMGNLPRSRPGRRSEKRATGAGGRGAKAGGAKASGSARSKAAPKPRAAEVKPRATGARKAVAGRKAAGKPRAGAAKAGASRAAGKRAAAGSGARKPAASRTREQAPPTAVRDERVEERQGQDPITAALRFGMAVGDAGLKVVAKVVERLPRP